MSVNPLDIAAKLNSYKRSNGQRMFFVNDKAEILQGDVRVNGNEVVEYDPSNAVNARYTLGVNCFQMIRTRKVETTETWMLDE